MARVNVILPGFVPTETGRKALSMTDEEFVGSKDTLGLPAGRLSTPQDIGELTLDLGAPASEWVTGLCIRIAGTPRVTALSQKADNSRNLLSLASLITLNLHGDL